VDLGRPETQRSIMRNERQILLQDLPVNNGRPEIEIFGALGISGLRALTDKLGFKNSMFPVPNQKAMDDVISTTKPRSTVFLCGVGPWSFGSDHCIRVGQLIRPGYYEILDPIFPKAEIRRLRYRELIPAKTYLLRLDCVP
jgi:hypothetical protein